MIFKSFVTVKANPKHSSFIDSAVSGVGAAIDVALVSVNNGEVARILEDDCKGYLVLT